MVGSHLRGTFTCGRAAAAQFREQGGGGRLAIWSHPVEVVSVLKDGGWDVDGIADLLPGTLRDHHQEFRPAPLPIPAIEGTKQ